MKYSKIITPVSMLGIILLPAMSANFIHDILPSGIPGWTSGLLAFVTLYVAFIAGKRALTPIFNALVVPSRGRSWLVWAFVLAGLTTSIVASLINTSESLLIAMSLTAMFMGSAFVFLYQLASLWTVDRVSPIKFNDPTQFLGDLSQVSLLAFTPFLLKGQVVGGAVAELEEEIKQLIIEEGMDGIEQRIQNAENCLKLSARYLTDKVNSEVEREINLKAAVSNAKDFPTLDAHLLDSPWRVGMHTVLDFVEKGGRTENIVFIISARTEPLKDTYREFINKALEFKQNEMSIKDENFKRIESDNIDDMDPKAMFAAVQEVISGLKTPGVILNATSGPSSYTSILSPISLQRNRLLQYVQVDRSALKTIYLSLSATRFVG